MNYKIAHLLPSAALFFAASTAYAIPVTINMTSDNSILDGGLCFDASCTSGNGWSSLGSTTGFDDWRTATTITLDLDVGTHYLAWQVGNYGNPNSGNPAALLAEIFWQDEVNYSSTSWEIYDFTTGDTIAAATEYGLNGGNNIWNSVNRGAVSGISGNAAWIYTADNFADADSSAWIRTSVTIVDVTEPGPLALIGLGLLGLGLSRRLNPRR